MKIEYKLNKYQPILENTVATALEVQVDHAAVLERGELAVSYAKLERLTRITGRLLESLVGKDIFTAEEALAIITDNQGELISAVKESE